MNSMCSCVLLLDSINQVAARPATSPVPTAQWSPYKGSFAGVTLPAYSIHVRLLLVLQMTTSHLLPARLPYGQHQHCHCPGLRNTIQDAREGCASVCSHDAWKTVCLCSLVVFHSVIAMLSCIDLQLHLAMEPRIPIFLPHGSTSQLLVTGACIQSCILVRSGYAYFAMATADESASGTGCIVLDLTASGLSTPS